MKTISIDKINKFSKRNESVKCAWCNIDINLALQDDKNELDINPMLLENNDFICSDSCLVLYAKNYFEVEQIVK